MSLYGSIAMLAVLLFRLVFKNCPKRILILFWIAVAVRLICPFNFRSPTSVMNFARFFPAKTETTVTEAYDPGTSSEGVPAQLENDISSDASPAQEGSAGQIVQAEAGNEASKKAFKAEFMYWASIVWFVVMAGMLIFSGIRYARFYSKAKWSSRSFDGKYYMANDIDSPFVVGLFDPKIFFPINMDDDEREYVLNHEWIHIKNKDSITKLVSYVILCIHWFNPLVWLAFIMLCADIEMRVDEETTDNFSLDMVKEYCKSLVRHAADDKGGAFMQSTAFSGLGFGGMETKLRITNLIKRKDTTRVLQILSIALTIPFAILISAFSMDHEVKSKKTAPVPEETTITESAEALPSETSESTMETMWNDGFIEPYVALIESFEATGKPYNFTLIYVDDDLVPELVVDNLESDFHEYGDDVSLYTYKDGMVVPVIENAYYDVNCSEVYEFVARKDFICKVTQTAGGRTYYFAYTMDDLINGKDPFITGSSTDSTYMIDSKQVSEKEFSDTFGGLKLIMGENRANYVIGLIRGDSTPGNNTNNTQPTNSAEATPSDTATPTPVPTEKPSLSNMEEGYSAEFDMDYNFTYYLNGNFGTITIKTFASQKAVFTINGCEVEADTPSTSHTTPYLVKTAGMIYVIWNFRMSEGWDVYIYNIGDARVTLVGSVPNLNIDGAPSAYEPFWCTELYGDYGLCNISRKYYINPDTGFPITYDHACEFGFGFVKAKRDITGYIYKDGVVSGTPVTISKDEEVKLERADEMSYLLVKDSSNNYIYIDISDAYDTYYYRGYSRWIYDALTDMFYR
ncbi:MAG: hypothetical protein IKF09_09175 [Clostridiales bacterium]|nr:hypothetical protein [Clostridiales bacterium]